VRGWPPKDWRALLALLFSVMGAVILTLFLWWATDQLQPDGGWQPENEAQRLHTIRWILWIVAGSIGAVLIGLGMAINRRSFKGNIGGSGFDFEGGEPDTSTPAGAANAVASAAGAKAEQITGEAPQREIPNPKFGDSP
jgi:hypothetical protein